jgi:hypothetical protein
MKKEIGIGIVLYFLVFASLARGEINLDLVDIPTARVLEKYQTQTTFRFYGQEGLLVKGKVGLTDRLTIGASYGGVGVVGDGEISWNPRPTLSLAYRISQESEDLPFSLTLGYEGQGYGLYYGKGDEVQVNSDPYLVRDEYEFYQTNSKGFFLVMGKEIPRGIYVLGGINHSLDAAPLKKPVSFFLGVEEQFTSRLVGKLEYNNIFHEEIKYQDFLEGYAEKKVFRKGGGELNLGICWYFSPSVSLEFDIKDVTRRFFPFSGNRVFRINYFGKF